MSNAKAPQLPPAESAPCGMCKATGKVQGFWGKRDCQQCEGTGTILRYRTSRFPPPPPKKNRTLDINLRADASAVGLLSGLDDSRLATIKQQRDEIKFLRDLLRRIAIEYPAVAGANECPPTPHGCPKCEIHFLLAEFAESEAPQC